MQLTLIRHGQTEGNLRNLYYGSTDLPLTKTGADALRSDPPAAPQALHYYTSGMRRTEQTFAILFGAQPHEILPGLREIDFGHFEMRSYADLKEDPEFQAWCEKGNGNTRFGIYACSPENSSFRAVFTNMEVLGCQWKAHNGQQPD